MDNIDNNNNLYVYIDINWLNFIPSATGRLNFYIL